MKKSYEDKILSDWEGIYQQGLLTFWVFVALRGKTLSVSEIRESVSDLTNGTYNTSEQALYRSLRKYFDLELLDYSEVDNPKGPKRKLYKLSEIGEKVLTDFAQRNILLFMQKEVQELMKMEKEEKYN